MTDRLSNTEFECFPPDDDVLLSRRSSDMGPSKLSNAAPTFDMSAFAVDGVYDRKLAMDELDNWLNNNGFEDKLRSERRSYEPRLIRGITRGEAQPSFVCPSRSDRGRPPVKTPKNIEARIDDRRVSVDELDDWLHGTCFGENMESGRRLSVPDATAASRGVKRRRVARRNNSAPDETTEADFCRPSRPMKLKLKSAVPMHAPLEASGPGVQAPKENVPKPVFYETDEQTCSPYFLGVMAERGADVFLPRVRRGRQAPGNADLLPWPRVSPLQRCLNEHPRQLLCKTGQDILRQDRVSQLYLLQTHYLMQGLSSGGQGQTGRALSAMRTQRRFRS